MTASSAGAAARRIGQVVAALLTVAAMVTIYTTVRRDAGAGQRPRVVGGASAPAPAVTDAAAARALPADAVYDAPAGVTGDRRPVLVSREGGATRLDPGGPVEVAVKVPTGWVLRRATGAGDKAVLHVGGAGVTTIARGEHARFWVEADGERLVVDDRPDDGAGRLVAYDTDGLERDSADVPAGTVVVDWVAGGILLRYPPYDGLDYWWPEEQPYDRTPGDGRGRYLGRIGADAIAVIDPSGCVARLARKWPLTVQKRRCGPVPGVRGGRLAPRWSGLSPGGALAVPGKDGLRLGHVEEVLRGGPVRPTDLPYEVEDLEWIAGGALAVLTGHTPGVMWSCRVAELACVSAAAPAYEGLALRHLAARRGAG